MQRVACSEAMEAYFEDLARKTDEGYAVARRARGRGKDPETFVEIPKAEDLASRVEKLLEPWNVEGVAKRIRDLSKDHNREEVSLLIAKEIARKPAKSREEAIDRAIRVGLAVLTEGILVAPLEGIADVKIGRNGDGSEYLDVLFAGPIRAAGGTGQAMSVLIGDVVRREHGIGEYVPTDAEVARFDEEIPLYKQCQHLQYTPSHKEIDLIVRNCPVCIDGEGTEETEVSGYRDLPRIESNRVRGGACLVIAEGLCQKAPKIQKHVRKLGIDGWDFISEYLEQKGGDKEEVEDNKVGPAYKYLKDIVAGRPIFGHPSRPGGFRLRYGRGRTTGLAAIAMNPASMVILDSFPALGTQIKIERPGKAGAVTPCDSIEGPIVLLDNGDLMQVNTEEEAIAIKERVVEIVDVGELLIPFGEFSENNHVLVPSPYTIDWHRQELLAVCDVLPDDWEHPTFERALDMSSSLGVPLHPDHNLFWYDLQLPSLVQLRDYILEEGELSEGKLLLRREPAIKGLLESLGALHLGGERLTIHHPMPLLRGLGLRVGNGLEKGVELEGGSTLQAVSKAMGVEVRARAMTRIGTRMARPEKAKERKMNPPVHVLFPIGLNGGTQRLLKEAARAGKVEVDVGVRRCNDCGKMTYLCQCPCGSHTRPYDSPTKQYVDLGEELDRASANVGEARVPDIKAVQGMMSKTKTPEPLEKGILRAKRDIFVFKDGTIRFDMTDIPVTHFRPREISLPVDRARELGYLRDVHGNDLVSDDQLLELRVQDFIPSASCGDYLVRVAQFIDELLVKHYGLEPFYGAERMEDLIGAMGIGLAPHTSGGVLCRIIGFTRANGGYAHPFFHAAKRRNCDGDEDSIILLMDGLINFSRSFLPDRRGGLMDAPLVLTTRLDPNEVDKEAHNVDLLWEYPLEFYQATMDYLHPKDLEEKMDMVGGRIGSMLQFEGFGFTHDTSDIAQGPKDSAYKTLETMMDKMDAQLELARKIRAVDAQDVVSRVINKHFLPDMIGNLKSFSNQKLRCTKCGAKYRRIPLSGRCYCGNNLTMTVHEKSVKKYLAVTKEMGAKYGISRYTQQRIAIVEEQMNSLFENDKVKKCKLTDFF